MTYAQWLSGSDQEALGWTVARADLAEPADVERAVKFAEVSRARLLVARVDVGSVPVVHRLEEKGFRWMDTLIRYGLGLHRIREESLRSGLSVRRAVPGDACTVEALARESFSQARSHYHADPRISPHASQRVYGLWARRACEFPESREAVFISEEQGRSTGFGVTRITPEGTGEAVLAGVSPTSPTSPIYVYRALLAAGARFALEHGVKRAFTSTQQGNFAIQRMWIRMGWEPDGAWHTYHFWRDPV